MPNTVHCSQCGTENPAERKFCRECGNHLAGVCPACSAINEPGDKFCGNCGTDLRPDGVHVAEVSVESSPPEPSGDGGARRFVSVLFADIVSYTTFSEHRDSDDVRNLLLEYFDRARNIIERYGGVVDKFIGDAVMGVWGAGAMREDDAERAVRAALDLVEMVTVLGEERGLPELRLRAGVNTGATSVGPGGNEMGLVVGDLVNTAARLQSTADPGTVFVGSVTHDLTRRAIAYEDMGERSVKGKSETVPCWKAIRVATMVGGAEAGAVREPPFAGRDAELRILKDALGSVEAEGRARLISIIGEAGIGKSRLAEEFKKYIDGLAYPVFWHRGRSPSISNGTAFWALGEMVRERIGVVETEEGTRSMTRLRTALADLVPTAEDRSWLEPRLAGLLGLGKMPEASRSELFAGWRSFFQHVALRGPTVMVFEDLHWADAGLVEFIAELVDRSTRSPILVISLSRPDLLERHPEWAAGRRNSMAVRLAPIHRDDMANMLSEYLPGVDEAVIEQLTDRSGGFPLYAVEMVRMLFASGSLLEDGERYRFAGDGSDIALPDSLHAVIGARLDRLEPELRAVIADAAVLGQTFTRDRIAHLSRLGDSAQLDEALQRLVALEILDIEDDPRSPERGQFGFVQSLIREVAYQRMGKADRRAKHLMVADHLDSMGLPELAGVVARHYVEAYEASPEGTERDDLLARAVGGLVDAADRAALLHSHAAAMDLYDQAAAIADPNDIPEILMKAAASAFMTESVGRVEAYLADAADRYRAADDEHGLRSVAVALSRTYNSHLRSPDAVDVIEPVYIAMETIVDELDVEVAAEAARGFSLVGRMDEALEAADALLPVASRLGAENVVVDTLVTRATALSFAGRLTEGMAGLRGAAFEAARQGFLTPQLRALNNLVSVLWYEDPRSSLEVTAELAAVAERAGNIPFHAKIKEQEAFFAAVDGRYDDVQRIHAEVVDEWGDAPSGLELSVKWARWVQTEDTEALTALKDDLEPLALQRDPQMQEFAKRWLAEVAFAAGDSESAYAIATDIADIGEPFAADDLALLAGAAMINLAALRAAVERLQETEAGSIQRNLVTIGQVLTAVLEDGAAAIDMEPLTGAMAFLHPRLESYRSTMVALIVARVVGLDHPVGAAAAEQAHAWIRATGSQLLESTFADVLVTQRHEAAG